LSRDQSGPGIIMILTAEPRRDVQTPISSRYPHLPQRSQTDSQGRFKFESVDPGWLYHVLIIAPGCRPKAFDRIDPLAEPLTARLEVFDRRGAPPNTALRGRVLDRRGQPVSAALIRIQ